MSANRKIETFQNLQSYFYGQLHDLNLRTHRPIPQEIIYYTSDVLDRYSLSSNFFEDNDGKISQKVLGVKLLEASFLGQAEQARVFQDIGDTSLLICSCFVSSTQNKLVDSNYYSKIGMIAYRKLNDLNSVSFDHPDFYKLMSTCFSNTAELVARMMSLDNLLQRF